MKLIIWSILMEIDGNRVFKNKNRDKDYVRYQFRYVCLSDGVSISIILEEKPIYAALRKKMTEQR